MDDMIVSEYPDLVEVSKVEPLDGFSVSVKFSDQSERVIDLEPFLFGPVFEPIRRDPKLFGRVFVDDGALAWPNGSDIDTDTLYYGGPPPWAQKTADHPTTATKSETASTGTQHAARRAKSKVRSKARAKRLVAGGTRKSKRG